MRKENKLYYFGGKLGPNALKVIWKFQTLNCFISFRGKYRSNSLIKLFLFFFLSSSKFLLKKLISLVIISLSSH